MKPSKPLFLLTILVALVLVAGSVMAEEETAKDKPGVDLKKMDGKELFKNVCKNCHQEDSEAGEYTPMTLIIEQWEEFFDGDFTETHKDVVCPSDKEAKLTDHLDKDMLKKIRKFCIDHAADSEQPMTCG